jgi:hypothetical protein
MLLVWTVPNVEWISSSPVRNEDEWLERLAADAKVATVLGSVSSGADTVTSERWGGR